MCILCHSCCSMWLFGTLYRVSYSRHSVLQLFMNNLCECMNNGIYYVVVQIVPVHGGHTTNAPRVAVVDPSKLPEYYSWMYMYDCVSVVAISQLFVWATLVQPGINRPQYPIVGHDVSPLSFIYQLMCIPFASICHMCKWCFGMSILSQVHGHSLL